MQLNVAQLAVKSSEAPDECSFCSFRSDDARDRMLVWMRCRE